MKETTAYLMTSMMKTVLTYGTGTRAALPGIYQAGKTGTSNYSDDELAEIEESTGIYNSAVGTMECLSDTHHSTQWLFGQVTKTV